MSSIVTRSLFLFVQKWEWGYLFRVPHYDLSRKMNGLPWWKPKIARVITPQR
ncbi:Uncharacterised protein [Vibrio cholerae]|nr:Uncharacterised protein [Vibrio cholerae]CSI54353.1 Uncharacterised protein [Vibrio cholerae]